MRKSDTAEGFYHDGCYMALVVCVGASLSPFYFPMCMCILHQHHHQIHHPCNSQTRAGALGNVGKIGNRQNYLYLLLFVCFFDYFTMLYLLLLHSGSQQWVSNFIWQRLGVNQPWHILRYCPSIYLARQESCKKCCIMSFSLTSVAFVFLQTAHTNQKIVLNIVIY